MPIPFYTRGDKTMSDTPTLGALVAEFEAERDRLDVAFTAAGALASGAPVNSMQAAAASETVPLFIADRVMKITSVKAYAETAAAAAESETIDILKNGVSVLTAVITLDDAAADAVVSGALKTDGTATLAVGDKVTIARVYVAGGAPTPMANILASVGLGA